MRAAIQSTSIQRSASNSPWRSPVMAAVRYMAAWIIWNSIS
jgi:hypothetical protein